MCTGLEFLAATASATSVASGINALAQGSKKTDPAAERAKLEAEATQNANARLAERTKALQANSLLTGAPGGKTTFGG